MRLAPDRTRAAPSAVMLAAALGLALAPALAEAQFQPLRMRLPARAQAEVVAARLTGQSTGDDLLILEPDQSGPLFQRYDWYRDLVTDHAPIAALPGNGGYLVAGRFEPAAAGAAEDLAYSQTSGLLVRFGADPGTRRAFTGIFGTGSQSAPFSLGKARLLPRPEPVVVAAMGQGPAGVVALAAADLSQARGGGAIAGASWAVPAFDTADDGRAADQVFALRLSPAAVAADVEDVVIPFRQALYVLWHASAPAAGEGLEDLEASMVPLTSGARNDTAARSWLPTTLLPGGSVHGVAALDADGDGDPDLVFTYANDLNPSLAGALLYARNDGAARLAAAPWSSLQGRTDLAPIVDPLTTRQLPLDPPVLAVFDRTADQIFLVHGDGRTGFTLGALPADGATPREVFLADLVGTTAPDLAVLAVLPDGSAEVWVYPDEGDAAPSLSFDAGPPAEIQRGQDLPLSARAADPDSPVTVTWMLGDRLSAPRSAGTTWLVPGALLCQSDDRAVFTARATDDLGVFVEVTGSSAVVSRPSLRLVGEPPDRLTLRPAGTEAEAESSAWPACRRTATFTWGEQGLPGLLETGVSTTGATSLRRFTIPESAYPQVLAGAPALTVQAVDDLGASGAATLPLALDAQGLAVVSVSVDRAALARGEVAVVSARLASRLGVALPSVRAQVSLAGLALAGAPTAEGAALAAGPGGALTLDALPAAGREVRLDIPVRGLGTEGEVAVALLSSGGHRLTPPVEARAGEGTAPGCGCGSASGGGLALGAAVLLAARAGRAGRAGRGGRRRDDAAT